MCYSEDFGTNWEAWGLKPQADHFAGPCPFMGGRDRLYVYPHGNKHMRSPKLRNTPFAWCRVCGMTKILGEGPGKNLPAYVSPPPAPMDPELALKPHRSLTKQAVDYFRSRGISDEMIELHKLGWAEDWLSGDKAGKPLKRYSIPCWDEKGNLWAIQYRSPYPNPKLRYISEPRSSGGTNDRLFNTPILGQDQPLETLFIDESPLDALMLTSQGFPAVAPFSGNSAKAPWRLAWTKYVKSPKEIVIIAQNDEQGTHIAASRFMAIGRNRVVSVPDPHKDSGDMFKSGANLSKWLQTPKKNIIYPCQNTKQ